MITDLRTAEMIKYASNAFLATKISFINEIANICEALGADVKEVATGMGYDKRIGRAFLDAGIGYGGSCFPKDVKALAHMALVHGSHPQLLQAVMDINADGAADRGQVARTVGQLDEGRRSRHSGAGFQTQHRRHARVPADRNHPHVAKRRGTGKGYDPVAMGNVGKITTGLAKIRTTPPKVAMRCDLHRMERVQKLDLQRIK